MLSGRPHGEGGLILRLITLEHGVCAGYLPGARSRAGLSPGTRVAATWRAKLADQLGTWRLEPDGGAVAARILDDRLRLACLSAACGLLEAAMPERVPAPPIFHGVEALVDALPGAHWDAVHVRFELGVLSALGFGLDLGRCAVTGQAEDLTHVSPKSGRAVSAGAAEPYRDRLLALPGFLAGGGAATPGAVRQGLDLTGYFIERVLLAQTGLTMPPARLRYVAAYERFAAKSGYLADQPPGTA